MESVSTIQFIAGALAVVVFGIIIWRRRRQPE
jgi:LPXTG-motif cell wall-anchored protein